MAEGFHNRVRGELRIEISVHGDLSDDVDGISGRQSIQLKQLVGSGLFPTSIDKYQGRVEHVWDQGHQVACGKARVENGPKHLPLGPINAHHVILAEKFVHV